MGKKYLVPFLFIIISFSLGHVFASGSSSGANFTMGGCWFEGVNGEDVGLFPGTCSVGEYAGYFYCDEDSHGYITTNPGAGCSMGNSSYVSGDGVPCCPSGSYCEEITSGSYQCVENLANCSGFGEEGECEDNYCYWMNSTGKCVLNPRAYACDYYNDSGACLEDKWGLGNSGVGTGFCGTSMECDGKSFMVSGCSCEWYPNAKEGEHCQLNMDISDPFIGGTEDAFECSSVFTLGDCVNGVQNVSWLSEPNVLNGFTNGTIPSECLEAAGCNDGTSTRHCAEDSIKLPFFSLFNFIVSLLIICVYYFILGNFKYKDGFNL